MKVPVTYKGKMLDIDFRCDLFVEQCIVVELKSVQEITATFEAQPSNLYETVKISERHFAEF